MHVDGVNQNPGRYEQTRTIQSREENQEQELEKYKAWKNVLSIVDVRNFIHICISLNNVHKGV